MSDLAHAQSFRDLIVYQKCRALAKEIKETSQSFPRDEKFSLIDQVRRSSRAIGASIAESWAKRRYEKHFISKLTDSDGEPPRSVREEAAIYFTEADDEDPDD